MTKTRAVTRPDPQSIYDVTDVRALQALVHPLRPLLLRELRRHGPATASELARHLGESSGATSYHLRQLARFGYVRDDVEQPSRRERRWRALHAYTRIDPTQIEGAAVSELLDDLTSRQIAQLASQWQDWQRRREDLAPEWQRVVGVAQLGFRLTPAQTAELIDQLMESARRMSEAAVDDDTALPLSLFFAAIPEDDAEGSL